MVVASLELDGPVLAHAVLQAGGGKQTGVQEIVAVAVELHILVDVHPLVVERVVVGAGEMAVKPDAGVEAEVAEAAQPLAAKAEGGHHGQLQVVVAIVVLPFVEHRTVHLVVLLRVVEIYAHAQPVLEVVLPSGAGGEAEAALNLEVCHVLLVHGVEIVVSSSGSADAPLGVGCDSRQQRNGHRQCSHFHHII